jgi:hypothetical protein
LGDFDKIRFCTPRFDWVFAMQSPIFLLAALLASSLLAQEAAPNIELPRFNAAALTNEAPQSPAQPPQPAPKGKRGSKKKWIIITAAVAGGVLVGVAILGTRLNNEGGFPIHF